MSSAPEQARDNALRCRRLARLTADPRLAEQLRERADFYDRERELLGKVWIAK